MGRDLITLKNARVEYHTGEIRCTNFELIKERFTEKEQKTILAFLDRYLHLKAYNNFSTNKIGKIGFLNKPLELVEFKLTNNVYRNGNVLPHKTFQVFEVLSKEFKSRHLGAWCVLEQNGKVHYSEDPSTAIKLADGLKNPTVWRCGYEMVPSPFYSEHFLFSCKKPTEEDLKAARELKREQKKTEIIQRKQEKANLVRSRKSMKKKNRKVISADREAKKTN